MKPLSLSLSNFQSYSGDHALDLEAISLAVLSGPNGSGKSSIIQAIRWALWGASRTDANGVITEGQQVCRVEFRFALNGDTYLVSRQRSRKGGGSTTLSFQRTTDGAQVLDGKTVADTQRRIEEVLSLTDDLFCATACASQGDADRFSRARPADRKAVLVEILQLSQWERRAEAARQMQRDLSGRVESLASQIESLSGQASRAQGLLAELGRLNDTGENLDTIIHALAQDLDALAVEREELVKAQAEDAARRRELVDLGERLAEARRELPALVEQVTKLRERTSLRAQVEQSIRDAKQAQADLERWDTHRANFDALNSRMGLLQSQIENAEQAKAAEERAAHSEAAQLRMKHQGALDGLRTRLPHLEQQAEVLESVPCATAGASDLVEACPLIAQARTAREELPGLRTQIAALEGQTPWAEAEAREREIAARPVAEDLRAELAEVTERRAALGVYDPAAHKKAKETAATLGTWQGRLVQVQDAEEHLPVAAAAEEAKQEEARSLSERASALEAELGPARDFPAELQALAAKQAALSEESQKAHAALEQCHRERGQLLAQHDAAQQAGEQAKELEAERAGLARRVVLLGLLGNPRDGAFSKGGVPALLIEQAIPHLEAAANDVLTTLSDGRMALELRTQKESSGKGMSETLEIVVGDERGPRLYETFSGGEAMRVDLALRIGLSEMLAARAGARCELLVCDETCAPLDAQGQAQFVEALGRVADRFATILCVTHIEALKDLFPTCIQVSKDGAGSRVEVVSR